MPEKPSIDQILTGHTNTNRKTENTKFQKKLKKWKLSTQRVNRLALYIHSSIQFFLAQLCRKMVNYVLHVHFE